jgi:hypothetical protein
MKFGLLIEILKYITFNCPSLNLNTSPFYAVKKSDPSNSKGDERWLLNSQILSYGRDI